MGEPGEELEPLFDYSRVQPAVVLCCDDDEFESYPIFMGGKRKRIPDPPDVKGAETQKVVINVDDGDDAKGKEDEEDWLAPRPKVLVARSEFEEDKTIRELRLKKQELASLAQSAEDVLKTVMESAKREISKTKKPPLEIVLDQPSKRQVDRQKIVISIQEKDGLKQFRVYKDDKLARLFKMYADKAQLRVDGLVFLFDGDKVSPDSTPEGLDLEDDDMLEVHMKSQ